MRPSKILSFPRLTPSGRSGRRKDDDPVVRGTQGLRTFGASILQVKRYTRVIAALLLPLPVAAQQLPQPPGGYGPSGADVVVDAAGILSPATIARINELAWELREKTGGELAVVTLPDLGGRDPAEVALMIGREWGVGASAPIGSRVRNAGVVVLVVPKETSADGRGHVRIEVGRGAEGFITDAIAGDIQRAAIPYFARRDYDSGVLSIVGEIARRFAVEFGVSLGDLPERPARSTRVSPALPVALSLAALFVALIVVASVTQHRAAGRRGRGRMPADDMVALLWWLAATSGRRGRRGGWTGGFGGGSFGGGGGFGGFGGGGGFSGGGSSGSW